jgi:Flp pilus assembly protein TadD
VIAYTSLEAQQAHDKALDLAANQNRELEAIPYFQKAYKLDPNNANFINDLSVVYMHTGNYEKSFDVLLRGK